MEMLQRLCKVSPLQGLELFLAVFRRGFRMARSSSDEQRIPDSSVSEGAVDTRGALSGGGSAGAEVVEEIEMVEKEMVRLRSLLVFANGNLRDIDRQLIDQLVDVLLPALSTLLLQVWGFLHYTYIRYVYIYIYIHIYLYTHV